jgi:hypothetical protein
MTDDPLPEQIGCLTRHGVLGIALHFEQQTKLRPSVSARLICHLSFVICHSGEL